MGAGGSCADVRRRRFIFGVPAKISTPREGFVRPAFYFGIDPRRSVRPIACGIPTTTMFFGPAVKMPGAYARLRCL
jgi:hypothetical protein